MKRYYEGYLSDNAQAVGNLSNEKDFADFIEGYWLNNEISNEENILNLTNDLIQIFQVSLNLYKISLVTRDSHYKCNNSIIAVEIDLWKLEALFKALKQNTSEEELIIHDQLYVDESESNSAKSFDAAIQSFSEMLKVNNNLKNLSIFHDGGISDKATGILAKGIRESKSLEDFEFSGDISHKSAQIMWQAVQENGKISDIRIDSLFQNDDSLMEIAEFLKINTSLLALRTIGLSEDTIKNVNINPLIEALSVNKNLTILEIGLNPLEVNETFVENFKTLLANNKTLTVLPILPSFNNNLARFNPKQNNEIETLLNENIAYLEDAKETIAIFVKTIRSIEQENLQLQIRNFKKYDRVKNIMKEYIEQIGGSLLNSLYEDPDVEESLISNTSWHKVEHFRNNHFFYMQGVCKELPDSLDAYMWSAVASYCDFENS